MGRIFQDQNQNQNNYSGGDFQGGRLARSGYFDVQEREPENAFGKFINFVEEMGKGVARDVVSTGLSLREAFRPTNIFRKPTIANPFKAWSEPTSVINKFPEPLDTGVNVFGERVKSIQRNLYEAGKNLEEGKINKKQFYGTALEEGLKPLVFGAPWEIVGKQAVKGVAKQGLKTLLKDIGESSVKYGLPYGAIGGASEAMKENAPWEEIKKRAGEGAVAGMATVAGLGTFGHYAGEALGRLSPKFREIRERYKNKQGEELKTKAKRVESVAKKSEKTVGTPSAIDIMDIVKKDKDLKLTQADKIKVLGSNKFANGAYRYNFKTKKGEIRVTPKTKPGTIAHEYAHHLNYKLGARDKFTNELSKFLRGEGRKPKAVSGYNAERLLQEIKKASRLGDIKFKVGNPSEEFATAFRNYVEKPEKVEKSAPLFAKFVKERLLKEKSKISRKNQKAIIIDPDRYKKIAYEKGDKTAYNPERHKEFSKKAKKEFVKQLKENKHPIVKLTAGGSGSGKSELVVSRISHEPTIILDGTLANKRNAIKKIKQIQKYGKKPEVYYILPRIESAWKYVQKRKLESGRGVPLDVFVDKHIGALKTIKYLLKHGVDVFLKDTRNVWTKTDAKYMPFEENKKIVLDKLNKIVYNRDELIKKLKNVKLSEKTKRKVLAELELKRRRIQKESKRTKQTRKKQGGSRDQSQVASGRRADQGLRKAKKSITSEKTTGESGFIISKTKKAKTGGKKNLKPIVPENIPKKFIPRKKDKTKYTAKVNTSDDVKKMVEKLEKSDEIRREIQKRGIVSWKETIKQAEEMGIDVSAIRKEAKNAKDFASKVEAIKQLRANKMQELHDFLSQAPRNPNDEQKKEIAKRIEEFLFIDRSLKSLGAEHGRAINILKHEVIPEEYEMYNDLIDKILEIDPKKNDELSYIKKVDKAINRNEKILNYLGLSRSMMTTADLSAPFRQGVFVVARHPVMFAKSFKSMLKQAFSEKEYQNALREIKNRDTYPLMRKAGLALTELDDKLTQREEAIMSNLVEKIPKFGKIARGSNRAYTGFLNKLRADYFDRMVKDIKFIEKGVTEKKLKDVAGYINSATGRGDLPKFLKKHSDLLNAVFFSPKLIASRVHLLNPHYYYKLDPYVRKQALKDALAFLSAGISILSLAKLNGAEVGTDPRSADFGKIKVGNTRYDIWGGFQQYMVLLSRLLTGEMVSSTTGKEFQLGEGYKATTRGDIIRRFFSYKTAPVTSFVWGLLEGKNSIGKKFDVPVEVLNRFIPMVISDFYDLIKDEKSPAMGIPGVFGVGVQTYTPKMPFMVRDKRGRRKIKWEDQGGLAEDIVNRIRGTKKSNIPKSRWKPLYLKKVKEDMKKAELANAKLKVLKTGKPMVVQGKRIFLKDGVVRTSK